MNPFDDPGESSCVSGCRCGGYTCQGCGWRGCIHAFDYGWRTLPESQWPSRHDHYSTPLTLDSGEVLPAGRHEVRTWQISQTRCRECGHIRENPEPIAILKGFRPFKPLPS